MAINCGYHDDTDVWHSCADSAFWLRFILDSQFDGLTGDHPHGGGSGDPDPAPHDPQTSSPTPTPDDCHRFADVVAEIAGRNSNAEDFMNEMARTFTTANDSTIAEMRRNADNALPVGRQNFGDSGFKSRFQDGSSQVRHFVGGLIVGYRIGYEALPAMDLREILPGGTMADLRLNEYSMAAWGASMDPSPARYTATAGGPMYLAAHPGYMGLADLIRRDVCN